MLLAILLYKIQVYKIQNIQKNHIELINLLVNKKAGFKKLNIILF